jgi:hypothetical protein
VESLLETIRGRGYPVPGSPSEEGPYPGDDGPLEDEENPDWFHMDATSVTTEMEPPPSLLDSLSGVLTQLANHPNATEETRGLVEALLSHVHGGDPQ